MTLRDQLVAAELTGRAFVAEDGYTSVKFLGNGEAAGRALAAFREWLGSDEAEAVLVAHQRLDVGPCSCGQFEPGPRHHSIHVLACLAAALDRKDPTP